MLIYSVMFCAIIVTVLLCSTCRNNQFYIKKGKNTLKENHRLVSILPSLSKIYEIIMFAQMTRFFETIFSKYQRGFRKRFQQCLKDGKNLLIKARSFDEALDSVDQNLLIVKLNAYHCVKSVRIRSCSGRYFPAFGLKTDLL